MSKQKSIGIITWGEPPPRPKRSGRGSNPVYLPMLEEMALDNPNKWAMIFKGQQKQAMNRRLTFHRIAKKHGFEIETRTVDGELWARILIGVSATEEEE